MDSRTGSGQPGRQQAAGRRALRPPGPGPGTMESMDSRTEYDAAARHPFVERGLRRLAVVTLAAGAAATAASVATGLLSRDAGYVRALLSSRSWGTAEPTAADLAAAQTTTGGVLLVGAGLLALTLLCAWLAHRPWRPVRWAGTVLAVLGLLTAAFWAVDGGTMVLTAGAAGAVALVLVVLMGVACAAWLLIAHSQAVREALDG
jgi:hypothetical protein